MLSRLAQLCLRRAETQTGALLPCLTATSSSAPLRSTWWPQQQHLHQQQQQKQLYSSSNSSSSDAVPHSTQQHQPAEPTDTARQGASESSSSSAALQPTQPALQVLKVLIEAERPLTSHELHARVQQQYSGFATRNGFKAYMKHLKRQNWAGAKPPLASRTGHKKSPKGSDAHWLYSPTPRALRVDLNAPGRPLQALAQQKADEWTQRRLPAYAEHMREGRVPVTWQNLGVLRAPKLRQKLFQQHVLAAGGRAARQQQLPDGGAAAAAGKLRHQQQQQQQQR